jgi:hypothetical protein
VTRHVRKVPHYLFAGSVEVLDVRQLPACRRLTWPPVTSIALCDLTRHRLAALLELALLALAPLVLAESDGALAVLAPRSVACLKPDTPTGTGPAQHKARYENRGCPRPGLTPRNPRREPAGAPGRAPLPREPWRPRTHLRPPAARSASRGAVLPQRRRRLRAVGRLAPAEGRFPAVGRLALAVEPAGCPNGDGTLSGLKLKLSH